MKLVPIVALVRDDVVNQLADLATERMAKMTAAEVEALRALFAPNGWTADAFIAGSFINLCFPIKTSHGEPS